MLPILKENDSRIGKIPTAAQIFLKNYQKEIAIYFKATYTQIIINDKGGVLIVKTHYIGERVKVLNAMLKELEKEIAKAPDGHIIAAKNKGTFQYYLKKDSKDVAKYISKSNLEFVQSLVQKEYNLRLKQAIEKRLRVIKKNDNAITYDDLFQIYYDFPEGKRILIQPYLMPIPEVAKMWAQEVYPENAYRKENKIVPTKRGEFVRSKSEQIIADMLYDYGIPYQYEYPFAKKDGKTLRPDFRVMNIRTHEVKFWEHFGIMDDSVYASHMVEKVNEYAENGLFIGDNLLISLETGKKILDPKMVEMIIKKNLLN